MSRAPQCSWWETLLPLFSDGGLPNPILRLCSFIHLSDSFFSLQMSLNKKYQISRPNAITFRSGYHRFFKNFIYKTNLYMAEAASGWGLFKKHSWWLFVLFMHIWNQWDSNLLKGARDHVNELCNPNAMLLKPEWPWFVPINFLVKIILNSQLSSKCNALIECWLLQNQDRGTDMLKITL